MISSDVAAGVDVGGVDEVAAGLEEDVELLVRAASSVSAPKVIVPSRVWRRRRRCGPGCGSPSPLVLPRHPAPAPRSSRRRCRTGARPGRRRPAAAPRASPAESSSRVRRGPAPARARGRGPRVGTVRSRCNCCGTPGRGQVGRELVDLLERQPDAAVRVAQHQPVLAVRVGLARRRRLVARPVGPAEQLAVELGRPARPGSPGPSAAASPSRQRTSSTGAGGDHPPWLTTAGAGGPPRNDSSGHPAAARRSGQVPDLTPGDAGCTLSATGSHRTTSDKVPWSRLFRTVPSRTSAPRSGSCRSPPASAAARWPARSTTGGPNSTTSSPPASAARPRATAVEPRCAPACAASRTSSGLVAGWRTRHEVLLRVYDELTRRTGRAPESVGGPSPACARARRCSPTRPGSGRG